MSLSRDKNGYPLPPNGAFVSWMKFLLPIVLSVLVIPITYWFLSVEKRLTVIDNTRWKLSDETNFQRQLDATLLALRIELTQIRSQLDAKVDQSDAPPLAYREEVDRRFDELSARIRRLEGGRP